MRREFEISRSEVGLGPHLEARAIAIVPGRRRMHLDFAFEFELGDAAKVFAQDFFFDFELVLVGGVLIVASSTASEVWTRRLCAVRRRLYYFAGLGASEAGFFFGEGDFDLLSCKDERDEQCLAASAVFIGRRSGRKASESIAAVDELFNGQEQDSILRHGEGQTWTGSFRLP